jgi:hypothetical protein
MKVHEETYKRCTIEIHQDEDAESPREWDNVGTMWCAHRRYNLGDEQFRETEPIEEKRAEIEKEGGIVLPLYLYDHSGITMRTSPFSCPWDSGQVGIIWATREKILSEWGGKSKRMTKKVREQATQYLVGEVQTYDDYLTGNVYGYVCLGPDGEDIDSLWGMFPNQEDNGWNGYVLSEAKSAVDHWRKRQAEKRKEERAEKKLEEEQTVGLRLAL